ncbi:MAG: Rieske 2Fe-2S domain-containing protein [Chloroflexota bacterium]|nr:Rieske 2Fe-2S domain-containing protein [Chloroflexota bacterium]
MGRYVVARVAEGRSIGVFNVHGSYYALRNSCPHQAAPLCLGAIKGMTMPGKPGEYVWAREGEILRCPWHGWEFDILTGRSIVNPHRTRVKTYEVSVVVETDEDPSVETYPVSVEDGLVVLHL